MDDSVKLKSFKSGILYSETIFSDAQSYLIQLNFVVWKENFFTIKWRILNDFNISWNNIWNEVLHWAYQIK